MRRALLSLLLLPASLSLIAQGPPPPLPPEVGNAVLLATHSIQVDRDVVVTTGDLVVNGAGGTLSVAQGVQTPPGFALKADAVTIDGGAVIHGNAHFNALQNNGVVNGSLITPLPLPVVGMLPNQPNRPAGAEDILVAADTQRILGTGNYGAVVLGGNATLRLPGGPYTFTSITAERGARIVWDGPGDVLVRGAMTAGADFTIAAGPPVTTKRKMFFVHESVTFGKNASIGATIHAPNGVIDAGQGLTLTGSFVARDIHIARDGRLRLRSGFRNLPPVAVHQHVTVRGEEPVPISLNGFDPDSDPLTFSIMLQPTNGTLSAITQTGPTSAVVTYTQRADPDDRFTFRVTDSEGFTAMGVVTINGGLPPPQPPTTVIAEDSIVEALAGPPTIIPMLAVGPPGVPLVFSIVTPPSHGTLGPLQQPSIMPQLPARIVYVPQQGYVGEDAFTFQACGVINGNQVCDQGVISIAVSGPEPQPELAPDLSASVNSGALVSVNIPAGPPPPPGPSMLIPAAVAGEVNDANNDGQGDDHAVPPLMAAGIGQPNGTVRLQLEWNLSTLAPIAENLQSATVLLRTRVEAGDTLTTQFYAGGTSGDGQLTAGDFQLIAEEIPQGVMPVPPAPAGTEGALSFDVIDELRNALNAGFTHF
ncbi:MAG TPA: Ig-like domain-containing protein, partial [Thermoanaerobaculia bacterium]|nr:Ig-like domain-containing protein [Thermoanaerobaculia bacterium]